LLGQEDTAIAECSVETVNGMFCRLPRLQLMVVKSLRSIQEICSFCIGEVVAVVVVVVVVVIIIIIIIIIEIQRKWNVKTRVIPVMTGDTSNNRSDWDHFKDIHKMCEQCTRKQ
jgi:hypothetical protein